MLARGTLHLNGYFWILEKGTPHTLSLVGHAAAGLPTRLLEMVVMGQRAGDPALVHDDKEMQSVSDHSVGSFRVQLQTGFKFGLQEPNQDECAEPDRSRKY
jgi:hypothetical protein